MPLGIWQYPVLPQCKREVLEAVTCFLQCCDHRVPPKSLA